MAAAAAKHGGPPVMMQAVAVLLISLIGAGAGIAVGSLLAAAREPAPAITIAAEPEAKEAPADDAAGEMAALPPEPEVMVNALPLPPILTNLAEPSGTWVRIEALLLVRKDSEEPPDLLAERLSEDIMAYLRTVKLRDIEGPSGLLHLRDDLDTLVATLSDGKARQILIHTLVLE